MSLCVINLVFSRPALFIPALLAKMLHGQNWSVETTQAATLLIVAMTLLWQTEDDGQINDAFTSAQLIYY